MLRTKLILISVTISLMSFSIPNVALAHCAEKHPQHCTTITCPCFDKTFLDDLHEQNTLQCDTNNNGDRLDRPELGIISLGDDFSTARIWPGTFTWTCHTQEPGSIFQDIPVTFEERIICAELLLTFIAENGLSIPSCN